MIPPFNLGCAKAWNIILKKYANDFVRIIANDDVEFLEDTIQVMVDNEAVGFIYPAGVMSANSFSCFL